MSCRWPITTLGEFASLFTGFPFKSNQFSETEGTKLLRGDNVAQGTLKWENVKLWENDNVIEKHNNYLLKKGDIILAMDRPWIEAGLKFSQIEIDDLPCYLVQRVACLRAKNDDDQNFLKYILGSRSFTEYIKRVQTGTVVPHISGKQILAFEFGLPPKSARITIGETLSNIDSKRSVNTQTNQTLEQMAQAIFKSWFVDFDPVRQNIKNKELPKINDELPEDSAQECTHRSQGNTPPASMDSPFLPKDIAALFPDKLVESELGLIPEGWEASSMGEHFNITMGQSPKGETYNENGEGIAFFQGRRDFGFRYPDVRVYTTDPKRFAKAGDTLISVRAPVGDKNMAAIDCCIGRGVGAIKHKSDSRSFTYAFISHIEKKLQDSGSSGTVFSSINQNELKKVSFIAPSDELVKAFHKLINSIDQKIEVLSIETDRLANLRDTLLPKLLSGEIELNELDTISGD